MTENTETPKVEEVVEVAPTADAPATPPTAETPPVNPQVELEAKIKAATKKVNEYLESAGLELRVVHTISLVPKNVGPMPRN